MDSGNAQAQASLPSAKGSCSYCDKETSSYCPVCFEGFDSDGHSVTTFYCNEHCRLFDSSTHQVVCTDYCACRQLYRAGKMIQEAFYRFRKRCFDISIDHIELKTGVLRVWEGNLAPGEIFTRFLGELVPKHRDRRALLSHRTFADALVWMHNLMMKSLEGIYHSIREVMVRIQGGRGYICFHNGDHLVGRPELRHPILQVTLNNGSVYALDFTAAQYGHYDYVVPWAQYVKERVLYIERVYAFGHFKQLLGGYYEQQQDNKDNKDIEGFATPIDKFTVLHLRHTHEQLAMKAFGQGVDQWLAENKTTIPDLLELPSHMAWDAAHILLAKALSNTGHQRIDF